MKAGCQSSLALLDQAEWEQPGPWQDPAQFWRFVGPGMKQGQQKHLQDYQNSTVALSTGAHASRQKIQALSVQSDVEAPVYRWDPITKMHFRIPSQFDGFPWFHAKRSKKYWPAEMRSLTQHVIQSKINNIGLNNLSHVLIWETYKHIPIKFLTKNLLNAFQSPPY